MTRSAVVLFTRDLRVHDHQGLGEAARTHDRVVPLFVLDDRILDTRAANRLAFLVDSLADLRRSLRALGSRFDPDGHYVRRHVPELEALAGPRVHEPWRARVRAAGRYPRRITDHERGRRGRRLRA
jgi:deoxyribodipyrimidine photo-lyase